MLATRVKRAGNSNAIRVREIVTLPSSKGWRRNSKTSLRNSVNSSRNRWTMVNSKITPTKIINPMQRILGYARVSSREQSENSHALEQQIARLKASGATEILFDVESGSKDERPDFNKLIGIIRRQSCEEVVVTRLDRLTRSLPTLRKVLDEFRKSGVNFRALDDSIDLSTAAGKFHLNMLGALAEMEVDRLSERVRHGWQHLRDRGVAVNPPFGYVKQNDRHRLDHTPFLCLLSSRNPEWQEGLLDDPHAAMSKAKIGREIVEAYLEQRTLRLALRTINERYGIFNFARHENVAGRVAREMFRFSVGGLRNWLTNPVLQGHTCYLRKKDGQHLKHKDWDIRYNTHPDERLISDEEGKEIAEILAHNAVVRGYGSTALKYPLSGLVFCGDCRSACYSLSGSRGKNIKGYNYYFQCKNWRARACVNKKVVRMEVVEKAVIDALTQRAHTIATLADIRPPQVEPKELKELKSQLMGLELLGFNEAIEDAKRNLKLQIEKLSYQMQYTSDETSGNKELLLEIFSDPTFWAQLEDEKRRRVYRKLVDRIVVSNGAVQSVILKV